jgi:hypothetical protein
MERDDGRALDVCAVIDEHSDDLLDCRCSPSYYLACDECDVVEYRGAARVYLTEHPTSAGCWKCERGLIPITRAEADRTAETLIIVHNR